jgi:hypothetical protein
MAQEETTAPESPAQAQPQPPSTQADPQLPDLAGQEPLQVGNVSGSLI